jgi:hypothetical protein
MGLDMYAFQVEQDSAVDDFSFRSGEGQVEIHYWRKHHNLHGWMENLYRAKGGTEEFNCVPVRVTLEDLDNLESAVKGNRLPETKGFFFGNFPPDEMSEADDMYFIAKARRAIHNGKAIYYDSWW